MLAAVQERPVHIETQAPPLHWYAAWTGRHCESLVYEQLGASGFDAFLPRLDIWSRPGRERRDISVPLFPGYLFVRHPAMTQSRARSRTRVSS